MAINKIDIIDNVESTVEKKYGQVEGFKRKGTKMLAKNAGLMFSLLILAVVIAVYTTDIKTISAVTLAQFGLSFFILLFCSYSMYINCSSSGIKSGKNNENYLKILTEHCNLKKEITTNAVRMRVSEFCKYYITQELTESRTDLLHDCCIEYEVYKEKYAGKDDKFIKKCTELSKVQQNAVIIANAMKAITLTADMILRSGRGSKRRAPLGISPFWKKFWIDFSKIIKITITSVFTSLIVFEAMADPSWATFVECLLKLFTVATTGVTGWSTGYNSITTDTTNYMSDQIDLMNEFKQYIITHPASEEKIVNIETTTIEAISTTDN